VFALVLIRTSVGAGNGAWRFTDETFRMGRVGGVATLFDGGGRKAVMQNRTNAATPGG